MRQRISFRGKRQALQQLDHAEAQFLLAVQSLRGAIAQATEAFDHPDAEVEAVRVGGYLAAITFVAGTELLEGHEPLREALLDAIEAEMNHPDLPKRIEHALAAGRSR